mgnify:CR=1 FL=1
MYHALPTTHRQAMGVGTATTAITDASTHRKPPPDQQRQQRLSHHNTTAARWQRKAAASEAGWQKECAVQNLCCDQAVRALVDELFYERKRESAALTGERRALALSAIHGSMQSP